MSLKPPPQWLAAQQARAAQPPRAPRVPLWAGADRIGSVEPALVEALGPQLSGVLQSGTQEGEAGWCVVGPLTLALDRLACALRDKGLAGAWRNEQLAVTGPRGQVLGTVERAAVRPLGITTFAVHLAGRCPQGSHWIQKRAMDKPNDPGLWDTLMGGMVPAADTLQAALARETQEEAGLSLAALQDLRHGGRLMLRKPSGAHGYLVEQLDWFTCTLPDGVVPVNQDGEVDEFRLMPPPDVLRRLLDDTFTLEAALVLCAAGL